jgi:hypothetical protein
MEIDITDFVANEDPFTYSHSQLEGGPAAGRNTWFAAKTMAPVLLDTPEKIEALRQYVEGFGAWDEEEIAAWDDTECNALFIQLVSGNMREAGMDKVEIEDFDWIGYEERASAGMIDSNIYRGDNGHIYYSLAN